MLLNFSQAVSSICFCVGGFSGRASSQVHDRSLSPHFKHLPNFGVAGHRQTSSSIPQLKHLLLLFGVIDINSPQSFLRTENLHSPLGYLSDNFLQSTHDDFSSTTVGRSAIAFK
jgi:hypothetical protein